MLPIHQQLHTQLYDIGADGLSKIKRNYKYNLHTNERKGSYKFKPLTA